MNPLSFGLRDNKTGACYPNASSFIDTAKNEGLLFTDPVEPVSFVLYEHGDIGIVEGLGRSIIKLDTKRFEIVYRK